MHPFCACFITLLNYICFIFVFVIPTANSLYKKIQIFKLKKKTSFFFNSIFSTDYNLLVPTNPLQQKENIYNLDSYSSINAQKEYVLNCSKKGRENE